MTQPPAPRIVWRTDIDTAAATGGTGSRAIYAVGDIHGRYDLAAPLLAAIAEDIRLLPAGLDPLIVLCGDYVDRGPRSAEVIAMLVWLRRHAPCETMFLKGNHEAMLLAFLDQPDAAAAWLRRDGRETLRSYGIDVGEEPADRPSEAWRDALMDRMPASHLDLLRGLQLHLVCGDYVFVHAGLRPGVPIARQSEDDCLWIRDDFLGARRGFDKIVVYGHSWETADPVVTPTRIGIDTGACHTGVLTAVRLGVGAPAFIQARDGEDDAAASDQHPSTAMEPIA